MGITLDEVGSAFKNAFSDPLGQSGPNYPSRSVSLSSLCKAYSDWDWHTAVAVSLAESGGRINARNKNSDGSTDHGLFQINDKAWAGKFDFTRMESDAQYAVWCAHQIWQSSGWSPWVTYHTGAYKHYLNHDAHVTTKPGANGATGALAPVNQDPASASTMGDTAFLGDLTNILGALVDPSTYARLGKGALGGVLIVLGVGGIVFIIANKVPTPVNQAVKAVTS